MVRRGSTVRVRQRALQKSRKTELFVGPSCTNSSTRRVRSRLWSFQIQEISGGNATVGPDPGAVGRRSGSLRATGVACRSRSSVGASDAGGPGIAKVDDNPCSTSAALGQPDSPRAADESGRRRRPAHYPSAGRTRPPRPPVRVHPQCRLTSRQCQRSSVVGLTDRLVQAFRGSARASAASIAGWTGRSRASPAAAGAGIPSSCQKQQEDLQNLRPLRFAQQHGELNQPAERQIDERPDHGKPPGIRERRSYRCPCRCRSPDREPGF